MKIESGGRWEWAATIATAIWAIVIVILVYKAYNP